MAKKQVQRKDIDKKYKWDIESMYADEKDWQKDIDDALALSKDFMKFAGILGESPSTLAEALKTSDEISQKIEKAFVYARMKRDEDNRVEKYQGMCDIAQNSISQIYTNIAFFTPELLSLDEEQTMKWTEEYEDLKVYRFLLEDSFREKEHVLPEDQERLMAELSQLNSTTNDVFTMLNNADLKFGKMKNAKGVEVELTHGSYINLVSSYDRGVRKEAYTKMYDAYKGLINTISTTYSYNTKTDVIHSKLRKYSSSRARALSGGNIPETVYDNLVKVINDNMDLHHRYLDLRKKVLGLENDSLKMYDVYVPLIELDEKNYTFEEAIDLIAKALQPLGEDYINTMRKGFADGWADVYENEGKTSGAYSFGSYDSKPFMLLNFTGKLKDVFTIVHELGHSMHSYYTRRNQPYIYGGHSIFTAEVASTVNENLLIHYLLDNVEEDDAKMYLLNHYLEEFRATVFRQTMFAEFEDITHKLCEEGVPLTAALLCDEYAKLNDKYFAPIVDTDELISYEWARIPHFYNAFYVYQYATGFSAATAIAEKILKDGPEDYLEFLKTGDSNYPIELLKIAGVDMATTEPIESAMKRFDEVLTQLENMVK